MKLINNKQQILVILLGFAVLYSLISLINHFLFRTYALDLGIYTNALYDYAHFQWNDSGVFKEANENLLADHFDVYLILFSPLSLLFKSYTLLIVQITGILLGGLGIYKYFEYSYKNISLAFSAMLFFFLFYGVYSALAFDYHSNVISACLVPWFFYFLKRKEIIKTSLFIILIIIGKENISLWMAFICLGLIFEYRKEAYWRNYLFFSFLFCLVYFFIITSLVMPSISSTNAYPHFNYSALGSNYLEAIQQLILHPLDSIKILFMNHTNHLLGNYIKMELFILLFLSGLPILFRKPQYLVMLLPIFAQKLYHDNISMWGVNFQYSIEFAPILAIGIFSIIGRIEDVKYVKLSSYGILFLCFASTIKTMDSTILFSDKNKIRVYKRSHYYRKYNTKIVREQLAKIPNSAIVSAQSPFLAQLAYRDDIYQFPIIKDAEYIIYSLDEFPYPLNEEQFDKKIQELKTSENWLEICNKDGFFILKKITP